MMSIITQLVAVVIMIGGLVACSTNPVVGVLVMIFGLLFWGLNAIIWELQKISTAPKNE